MGIIRQTKSVKLVLDAFHKSETAISVVNLVDSMTAQMNKSTVYRILDRLEQEGLLHSFFGKDGLKCYAKCTDTSSPNHPDKHPHFHCDKCGIVEFIPIDIEIPKLPKLKIKTAQIILTGTCAKCNS